MHEITVSLQLDEQAYKTLTRYAAMAERDIETIVSEMIIEQLGGLSLRVEQESIKTLSPTERRALARAAWGSWSLTPGTTSTDLVRELRSEWSE